MTDHDLSNPDQAGDYYANMPPGPLLCERCGVPIVGEPLEGIDLARTNMAQDEIAWTGRFYCSPGTGCNSHMPEDADYTDAEEVGWPS